MRLPCEKRQSVVLPDMKILVNTHGSHFETGQAFIKQTFTPLIQNFPQHQFIFIGEAAALSWIPQSSANVRVVQKAHTSTLMSRWWHYFRLPLLVKKTGADLIINANGVGCLLTDIPQLLFLVDRSIPKQRSNKKISPVKAARKKRTHSNLAAYMQKADTVFVPAAFEKQELIRLFQVPEEKIIVIGLPAAAHFEPLSPEEKETIKAKCANEKEFFLYRGTISPDHHIINLLKAFSLFKKRQQTNMQLLLSGKIHWPGDSFQERLSNYKYRSDVQLIPALNTEEVAKLTGAAYALINPVTKPGFSGTQLQAMCSGVPVIAASGETEPGNDAVLLADINDPVSIANQMMVMYKDEALRSQLIVKGNAVKEKYTAANIADVIWNCIEQAVKKR